MTDRRDKRERNNEMTQELSEAEAAWNEFRDSPDYTPTDRYPASDVFRAGYAAALSASHPREAAPSDTDPEPQFDGTDEFYARYRQWALRTGYGCGGEPHLTRVEVTADMVLVSKSTLTYAAGALEGSGDNGDRYCASQIRAALGGGDQ